MGTSRRVLFLEYNAFPFLFLRSRVCSPSHMCSLKVE